MWRRWDDDETPALAAGFLHLVAVMDWASRHCSRRYAVNLGIASQVTRGSAARRDRN